MKRNYFEDTRKVRSTFLERVESRLHQIRKSLRLTSVSSSTKEIKHALSLMADALEEIVNNEKIKHKLDVRFAKKIKSWRKILKK